MTETTTSNPVASQSLRSLASQTNLNLYFMRSAFCAFRDKDDNVHGSNMGFEGISFGHFLTWGKPVFFFIFLRNKGGLSIKKIVFAISFLIC